jgi:hypothetical protein
MLSLACVFVRVGIPSVEMWFDRGEDRYCGLSKVGMVETVGFHQVKWLVMLEYATQVGFCQVKCTTILIVELAITSGLGSSFD